MVTFALVVAHTRDGHSTEEIGFLMQISPSLVRQYQRLYERYNTPAYQARITEIIRLVKARGSPEIARETCHSPEAVDQYLTDFARIYFAHVERGMSVAEVVFAVQKPRYLVEEYVRLIAEFDLAQEQVYGRCGLDMVEPDTQLVEGESPIACGDMDTHSTLRVYAALPTSPQANDNNDELCVD